MNWTGGRLTRGVRKADNLVINKQKQHFAKVRNALLHGAKKSPAKWSIFDNTTINVKRGSSERGDNTPIRQGERPFSRHHGRHSSDLHQDSGKHRREVEEPEHRDRSKRRKLSPLEQKDRHDSAKIKKEAYEASAHKLHKTDVTDVDDEMEVLRRKKLKLLRNSDWLALGLQEPLKLKYAPTGVDDSIGRRRRLKPGHEARYEKSHVRLSPAHHRNYDTRSEVRVTIDGNERRVGVSSSAAPSRDTAPPISSHSQSSDVMLLEGPLESEASQMAHNQQGRHRHRRQSHSYMDDHNGRLFGYPASNKHVKEKTPPWEDLSRLADEAGRQPKMSDDNQPSFSSSSIRRMAEARGLVVPEDNEPFKSILSSSQDTSSQVLPPLPLPPPPAKGAIQQDSSGRRARNNGRLIVPSSPPILHHPVPRRATSQILRTNSLDIASSVAATVGELPTLTEAEERGDKMWNDWLDEDEAGGSDAGPRALSSEHIDSPRSITPGMSQYVPTRALSQSSPMTREASMPHNMMRLSSSVNSITMSASKTPSVRPQAMGAHPILHPMALPPATNMPAQPDVRQRVSLPLPDVKLIQRVADDTAWRTFVQSPSELRFDDQSPRPFQKPAMRRPTLQENQKTKTPDPDAAWKTFVLTNDSDSDGENPAFSSFWKKNERKQSATINATMRLIAFEEPLSSHASLEVHLPNSMDARELPELPFSRPSIPKSHTPLMSSSTTSDYFDDTQVLDDRSMYANQSQTSSTTEDLDTQVLDDRSMHVNQSLKTSSSGSVSSGPFQLKKGSGQTMIKGFFKPPPKLHAKAPLGYRDQSTFKRLVAFDTPQKAGRQSFVDGLDKKYVQEANRELRRELWKKPGGTGRADKERDGGGRRRQTKSIWDIPSSDDDHIEEM